MMENFPNMLLISTIFHDQAVVLAFLQNECAPVISYFCIKTDC